jgi:replication initiation and membrane attachment protein
MDPYATFKLIASRNLDHDHRAIVSLLYLPLIGPEALSLYFSLYALIDRSHLRTKSYPHEFLYDLLNLSKTRLNQAREKLEAVGLLESYTNNEDYIYELYAPLSAEMFIKDSPFAPYLLKQIGDERFEELIELFKIKRFQLGSYENISKAFSDLFKPVYDKEINTKSMYLNTKINRLTIEHDFNVELLIDSLPESFVHSSTKTKRGKEHLSQIAYVYNIDESTMKDLLVKSLNDDTSIDFEALSKACVNYYAQQPKDNPPKKTTGYDVDYFKNVHPVTIVEDLTGMSIPSSDLKIIEKILNRNVLKIEVVNVLIAFVLKELNYQFPVFNYFEKIMAQWKRHNIETAEEAIAFIKKQKEVRSAAKKPTVKNRKELPEDIKVDWLDDYIKSVERED